MFITLNYEKARVNGDLVIWERWIKSANQPDKLKLCDVQTNSIYYDAFYTNPHSHFGEIKGYFPKNIFDLVKEDYKIEDFL